MYKVNRKKELITSRVDSTRQREKFINNKHGSKRKFAARSQRPPRVLLLFFLSLSSPPSYDVLDRHCWFSSYHLQALIRQKRAREWSYHREEDYIVDWHGYRRFLFSFERFNSPVNGAAERGWRKKKKIIDVGGWKLTVVEKLFVCCSSLIERGNGKRNAAQLSLCCAGGEN